MIIIFQPTLILTKIYLKYKSRIPNRMKINTEFSLATWLRLVKFRELNISEFWFLIFNYIRCHWEISKKKIKNQKICHSGNSEYTCRLQWRFSACRVVWYRWRSIWHISLIWKSARDADKKMLAVVNKIQCVMPFQLPIAYSISMH